MLIRSWGLFMAVLWFVPSPALEFRFQDLHSVNLFRFGCMLLHTPFDEESIEFTQCLAHLQNRNMYPRSVKVEDASRSISILRFY